VPQPLPTKHVARFSQGLPTQQMHMLLEVVKQALLPVS